MGVGQTTGSRWAAHTPPPSPLAPNVPPVPPLANSRRHPAGSEQDGEASDWIWNVGRPGGEPRHLKPLQPFQEPRERSFLRLATKNDSPVRGRSGELTQAGTDTRPWPRLPDRPHRARPQHKLPLVLPLSLQPALGPSPATVLFRPILKRGMG